MTTTGTDTLREKIHTQLSSLVPGDYVLLDCPYHANIGDTLIWEGELAFLAGLPGRMLGCGSLHTWLFPPLAPQVTVLLHGGGNFGDLWSGAQDFRLRVIETYPDNPIVIFPQTVHYRDPQRLAKDAARMARHPRLTICARDRNSLNLLTEHFRNPVLLLPDMAFCIPAADLKDLKQGTQPLWLKRTDQELADTARPMDVPPEAAVRDWPTIERTNLTTWLVYKLSGVCARLGRSGRIPALRRLAARAADCLAMGPLRRGNLRTGVRFLTNYSDIYTTRLHGAILAILLSKERIVLIDNNYGKNSAFYESWLRELPQIRLLKPGGDD